MKCRFAKKALILCAALVTLNPVVGEEFKNSVVNLKLNKDSSGGVNVHVVTSKPYNSPVYVNEKANNTYVILLPETQNSICGKPVIDNVSNEISGISIKTQPYVSGGCKGYTKITIVSQKPINISAKAGVNVQNAPIVIKKDIKPQVKQPVSQQAKPQVKPVVKPQVEQAKPQVKPVVKPQVEQAKPQVKPVVKPQVEQPKPQVKPVVKQQVEQAKPQVKPVVKPQVQQPKPQVKPVVKPQVEQAKPQVKPVVKPQVQQAKPQVKPVVKPQVEQAKPQVKPVVETPVEQVKPEPKQVVKPKTNHIKKIQDKLSALAELMNLRNNLIKLLLVLSAIGFPLLVILFILLMNRKIKEQMEQASVNSESENNVVTYVQEQNEEENEVVEDSVSEIDEEKEILEETNSSFAEMMGDENIPETIDDKPLVQDIDDFVDTNISAEEVVQNIQEDDEEPQEEILEDVHEELDEEPQEETLEDVQEELDEEPQDEILEDVQKELDEEPQEETLEDVQEELDEDPQDEILEEMN